MWEDKADPGVGASSQPRASTQAPSPHRPPPAPPGGSPDKTRSAPGWKGQRNFYPERQHTYRVTWGSRRVAPISGESPWGGGPPAPKLRSKYGQSPGVERGRVPEKPRSLQATGFQGGEEEREGRREREGGEEWGRRA